MNVAYVMLVEDAASAFVPLAEVREKIDSALSGAALGAGMPLKPRDREAWLRGKDAREGQVGMLGLAKSTRRN